MKLRTLRSPDTQAHQSAAPGAVAAGGPVAAMQRRADSSPAAARLTDLQRAADGAAFVQRQAEEDELQMVRRAPGREPPLQRKADGGLPPQLKAGIESLSGMAMDDVRVNRNSGRPASVGARAFAQGSDDPTIEQEADAMGARALSTAAPEATSEG